jgi:flagellar protein FlaF
LASSIFQEAIVSLHTLARAAYGRKDGACRSPRSIEYDLFAQNTGRLAAAWQARELDHPALVRALYDNNRIWRKLALDCQAIVAVAIHQPL